MRALSIRQPWAELILRGIKTVEVRSRRTLIRGRVYIYASMNRIDEGEEARVEREHGIDIEALPRGVLVGTVEIADCLPLKQSDATGFTVTRTDGLYGWHLGRPERATRLRKPKKQPQPVFFNPF